MECVPLPAEVGPRPVETDPHLSNTGKLSPMWATIGETLAKVFLARHRPKVARDPRGPPTMWCLPTSTPRSISADVA